MTCLALAGKSTALRASGPAEPGSARLSRCRRYESARPPNPRLDSSRNSRRVRAGMRLLHENGFIIPPVVTYSAPAGRKELSRARKSIDEDEFVQIKGRQTELNESRCPRRLQRSHFGRQRFFPSFLPGLLRQLLQQRQCFFALLRGRAPRKRNSP